MQPQLQPQPQPQQQPQPQLQPQLQISSLPSVTAIRSRIPPILLPPPPTGLSQPHNPLFPSPPCFPHFSFPSQALVHGRPPLPLPYSTNCPQHPPPYPPSQLWPQRPVINFLLGEPRHPQPQLQPPQSSLQPSVPVNLPTQTASGPVKGGNFLFARYNALVEFSPEGTLPNAKLTSW
jgi:hypothetical protein